MTKFELSCNLLFNFFRKPYLLHQETVSEQFGENKESKCHKVAAKMQNIKVHCRG